MISEEVELIKVVGSSIAVDVVKSSVTVDSEVDERKVDVILDVLAGVVSLGAVVWVVISRVVVSPIGI